jgi:hypothetical protein
MPPPPSARQPLSTHQLLQPLLLHQLAHPPRPSTLPTSTPSPHVRQRSPTAQSASQPPPSTHLPLSATARHALSQQPLLLPQSPPVNPPPQQHPLPLPTPFLPQHLLPRWFTAQHQLPATSPSLLPQACQPSLPPHHMSAQEVLTALQLQQPPLFQSSAQEVLTAHQALLYQHHQLSALVSQLRDPTPLPQSHSLVELPSKRPVPS